MKRILFNTMILFAAFTGASAQTINLNAESGDRNIDAANCWGFGSATYSNASPLISGSWSIRSNSPSNLSIGACWIKSPWLKPGSGNITLKYVNQSSTAGSIRRIILSYIPYDASSPSASKEGTLVRFDSISYSSPFPTTTQNLSFAIPAAIANSSNPFRIMISLVGSGGNSGSRLIVDDIVIPGTYWANPSNSCLPQALIQDADNDGVADADDAYPNDAARAYNNFYPAGSYGTLMYEDLWPATGDYDFNDLVVNYRYNLVTNAANKVVEMKGSFVTRAIGASFRNGFAFQLNNLAPTKVTAVSGAKYHGAAWLANGANGTENGQTSANIIVFDDAQKVLPSPGGSGSNTIPSNPRVAPDTTNITVSFTTNGANAITLSDVIFNPYIIVDQTRGKEVHLPGFVPSSKVNTALFGTMQDDTNPGAGKYYKTKDNLPWALNVPTSIPYTHTTNDFITGYLKFADWAQSNGSTYADWYLDLPGYRDNTKLFSY